MSKGSTAPSSVTSTGKTEPWEYQQSYLRDIFTNAERLYNDTTPPQYYDGSTYAAPGVSQTGALDDIIGIGSNDLTVAPARNALNYAVDGNYIYGPGYDNWSSLFATVGGPTSGAPTLSSQAEGTTNAAFDTGANVLYDTVANPYNGSTEAGYLGSIASANPALGGPGNEALRAQAGGTLGKIYDTAITGLAAPTNPYVGSDEAGYLTDIARSNPAAYFPGYNGLVSLATGGGLNNPYDTAAMRLADSLDTPWRNTFAGARALLDVTGTPTDSTPGTNTLSVIADTPPSKNPATRAFDRYVTGDALDLASNPYTSDIAKSVMAQVVPAVQSQFIKGGMLNSPQAAYATSQGATAALAPILAQQYQQEEQNQLQAGGAFSNAYLQNLGLMAQAGKGLADTALGARGIQQSAGNALLQGALGGNQQAIGQAEMLGNLGVARGNLQQQAANALMGGTLTGAGLQSTAADRALQGRLEGNKQYLDALLGLGGLGVQGQNITQSAANALNTQNLTGAGLQSSAASEMLRGLLGGNEQSRLLGQTLGNLGLGQGNLAQSAASTLGSQELQGQGLQETAAQGVQNAYGQGIDQMLKALALAPSVQGMQYTGLENAYTAAAAEQQLRQQEINDAIQRWNYNQTLPWQMLNQYMGQVTGNYGGTTTLTQPFFQNAGSNMLGGAMGGASLGNSLFGPWGGVGGALLGGIFGSR